MSYQFHQTTMRDVRAKDPDAVVRYEQLPRHSWRLERRAEREAVGDWQAQPLDLRPARGQNDDS